MGAATCRRKQRNGIVEVGASEFRNMVCMLLLLD